METAVTVLLTIVILITAALAGIYFYLLYKQLIKKTWDDEFKEGPKIEKTVK